ncbi:MAG TPA: class I SAM-dependent methyltransferase [Ktedonobacterales bacterium]|nr:class I SAM-dependent methyltransferase [Ktedonobacterales bacterium]
MARRTSKPRDERATSAAARRRIAHWSGVAPTYDAHRPAAPAVLPALLTQLAETPRPALVVDLGSGTGLSTWLWADVAREVIGVEPNDEMRAQAERRAVRERPSASHLRFMGATAEQTGLPDGCADIVTVSQAFHWMEPTATLAEVARILRRGGVFAAYDTVFPPMVTWEARQLFIDFMGRVYEVAATKGVHVGPEGWEKSGHLERMRASGHFRQVEETELHNIEQGDAARYVGLTISMSSVLATGALSAEEIGLADYQRAVHAALPAEPMPWYFGYHVRLGVK